MGQTGGFICQCCVTVSGHCQYSDCGPGVRSLSVGQTGGFICQCCVPVSGQHATLSKQDVSSSPFAAAAAVVVVVVGY